MRVLLVGASGTLGAAVSRALDGDVELIGASRSGIHQVDITSSSSITSLYSHLGSVDAVVCTAGVTPFAKLGELTRQTFENGVADKLLGQVDLVLQGIGRVSDGGSFTLVSGVLAVDPIRSGAVASTVNGALDAFVRAAAIELPRGQRINAVSATVFREAWEDYAPYFPGHRPVPVADVARAYVKSVRGHQTGQVYRVGH